MPNGDFFMSQTSCEKPQRRCVMLSAAVLDNPNEMVRQMVLELKYDCGGTERAIEKVARDASLTYSKTYNLFYRRTHDVWSKQKKALIAAFQEFVVEQERAYRERANRLADINAEIRQLERQYGMDLPLDRRVAGQLDAQP